MDLLSKFSIIQPIYSSRVASKLMVILVGGPDRPPSKRMVEQMKYEESERRKAERSGRGGPPPSSREDEGYWAYMQRQVQERTERLGIMGDSMERLEESSSNWANDVSNFVSNQKRKAVLGGMYLQYPHVCRDITDKTIFFSFGFQVRIMKVSFPIDVCS